MSAFQGKSARGLAHSYDAGAQLDGAWKVAKRPGECACPLAVSLAAISVVQNGSELIKRYKAVVLYRFLRKLGETRYENWGKTLSGK